MASIHGRSTPLHVSCKYAAKHLAGKITSHTSQPAQGHWNTIVKKKGEMPSQQHLDLFVLCPHIMENMEIYFYIPVRSGSLSFVGHANKRTALLIRCLMSHRCCCVLMSNSKLVASLFWCTCHSVLIPIIAGYRKIRKILFFPANIHSIDTTFKDCF